MSSHALAGDSAYSVSWTRASRRAFWVLIVVSLTVFVSVMVGYFNYQSDEPRSSEADWSISVFA